MVAPNGRNYTMHNVETGKRGYNASNIFSLKCFGITAFYNMYSVSGIATEFGLWIIYFFKATKESVTHTHR